LFLLLSAAVAANLMKLPIVAGSLRPLFEARLNEGKAAAVQVRVVVSPMATPTHCSASFVNGPPSNADELCSMLRAGARFWRARDNNGLPAYGVIYLWSHWKNGKWAGSQVPPWNPPDLSITTNRKPRGVVDFGLLRFVLQIDSRGKMMTCSGPPGLTEEVQALLCRAAGAQTITPAFDDRAQPVPSVQEYTMRVISQPALDNVMKAVRDVQGPLSGQIRN
jgi:hypothetical protein